MFASGLAEAQDEQIRDFHMRAFNWMAKVEVADVVWVQQEPSGGIQRDELLADWDLGGSRLSGRPARPGPGRSDGDEASDKTGWRAEKFRTATPTGARETMRIETEARADAVRVVMSWWRPSGLKYRGRAGVDGGGGRGREGWRSARQKQTGRQKHKDRRKTSTRCDAGSREPVVTVTQHHLARLWLRITLMYLLFYPALKSFLCKINCSKTSL